MKKHIHDTENNKHLDQYRPGLKRQEFCSYEIKGKWLHKETIVRTYFKSGDYVDSVSSETICNGS